MRQNRLRSSNGERNRLPPLNDIAFARQACRTGARSPSSTSDRTRSALSSMRAWRARQPCCSTRRCWPGSAAASSTPASWIRKPSPARWKSSAAFVLCRNRRAPSICMCWRRPPRARRRTGRISFAEPKRCSAPRSVCCRGREEAYFSALGIVSGFHRPDGIAGDLGGGSLELVDIKGETIGDGITLPLGGLRLHDMAKGLLPAAARIAKTELARAEFLKGGKGAHLLCGRRHLAKPRAPAHERHQLSAWRHASLRDGRRRSADFLSQVARGEIDKISGIEAVSKNRRALLAYGAMVLQHIIAAMKPSKIVVSARRRTRRLSLLTAFAQRAERGSADFRCRGTGLLRARSVKHAHELVEWTEKSLRSFRRWRDRRRGALPRSRLSAGRHRLAGASRIPRHAIAQHHRACVADRRRPSRPGLHRAGQPLPPRGIFNEAAVGEAEGAGSAALSRAGRLLAALFRVVYMLSAAMPGLIPRLKWEKRGLDRWRWLFPPTHADLFGERPIGRVAQAGQNIRTQAGAGDRRRRKRRPALVELHAAAHPTRGAGPSRGQDEQTASNSDVLHEGLAMHGCRDTGSLPPCPKWPI